MVEYNIDDKVIYNNGTLAIIGIVFEKNDLTNTTYRFYELAYCVGESYDIETSSLISEKNILEYYYKLDDNVLTTEELKW